jgi:hypothetical protein
LSPDALSALIDEYIEEEALYREAIALGLDKSDTMLRKRLIRQLEFINQGLISTAFTPSEEDLQRFLAANKDRYFVPAKITFTHVFYNREIHDEARAYQLAQRKLTWLNETKLPFHKALSHGDRFLYHRNYVNRDAGEIASHFGSNMQQELFAVSPDSSRWHGPFQSPYGYHLVLVTQHIDGYHPPLDEIRNRVTQDALQAHIDAELKRITQSIVDGYDISIAEGIQQTPLSGKREEVEPG